MWNRHKPKDPYHMTAEDYAAEERKDKRRRGFFEFLFDLFLEFVEDIFFDG